MMTNVFTEAAELIREGGLAKRQQSADNFDGTFSYCIYGACNAVIRRENFQVNRLHWPTLLDKAAHDLFPERFVLDGINPWSAAWVNNHPDTTQEDAILILKHASFELELQESGGSR